MFCFRHFVNIEIPFITIELKSHGPLKFSRHVYYSIYVRSKDCWTTGIQILSIILNIIQRLYKSELIGSLSSVLTSGSDSACTVQSPSLYFLLYFCIKFSNIFNNNSQTIQILKSTTFKGKK